jgi:thymidine phosphorylase
LAEDCLASGEPRRKWDEMLKAQGADLDAFKRKLALDKTAAVVVELKAPRVGYVSRCDARVVGEIIRDLGGGRLAKNSQINYDVGVDKLAKPGEKVMAGAVIARVHAPDAARAEAACARLQSAFGFSEQQPPSVPLVSEVIG